MPAVSDTRVSVARVTRSSSRSRGDRIFYTGMAMAAAAAVFLGFAPTYYLRARFQSMPLPFYLELHGLVFSAWILLFVVQTSLVAARRTPLHRRLGWVGAGLAVSMVGVAWTAAVLSGRRDVAAGLEDEARAFLTTPLLSMVVFATLVGAAVFFRGRPDTHKRLMLLATLSILDAAVARWPFPALVGSDLGFYLMTDAFIAAALLYDVVSRRAVAPAYVWGALLIVAGQLARPLLGGTALWQDIARLILG
jgi:hypothetical protein